MLDTLIPWLERHSISIVSHGGEIRYVHPVGSSSILVPRDERRDGPVPFHGGALETFYSKYSAASIGDGHIMLGAPVAAGIPVSHGISFPASGRWRKRRAGWVFRMPEMLWSLCSLRPGCL